MSHWAGRSPPAYQPRTYRLDACRSALYVPSGAIRADLPAHWRLLSGTVHAGLAVRVVVLGAESTGSTTIARLLAEEYRRRGGAWADTRSVPEYARDYALIKWERATAAARAEGRTPPPLNEIVWETPDFDVVAAEQTAQEDAAAAAGSPLLICDTDALATAVWERRYSVPVPVRANPGPARYCRGTTSTCSPITSGCHGRTMACARATSTCVPR